MADTKELERRNRNTEMLVCDGEGLGEVGAGARGRLGERIIVEQVGPVTVDERAAGRGKELTMSVRVLRSDAGSRPDLQSETVLPAPSEVFDVDFGVGRRPALTPEEQAFLGVRAFLAAGGDRADVSFACSPLHR